MGESGVVVARSSAMSWFAMVVVVVFLIVLVTALARSPVLRNLLAVLTILVVVPGFFLVTIRAAREATVPPATVAEKPLESDFDLEGDAKAEPESIAKETPPAEPKRPSWVDETPGLVDGVYRSIVTVGPYKTLEECEGAVDEKLEEAVGRYVETYVEREPGLDARAAARVRLPLDEVHQSIVKDRYTETIVSRTPAVGSMIQLKLLLGFDRQANVRIQEAVRREVVGERIRWSGAALAGAMFLLLVAYGYLKTDLATQGAYRGRLRLAAATMILGVTVAAVLAAAS